MMLFRTIVLALIISSAAYGQTPELIRFQASIYNKEGVAATQQSLSFRVSILEGPQKQRVFGEFHSTATDEYGLVTLLIGSGNPITGTVGAIDWSNGPHFLKIEMDDTGGAQFVMLSETQLLSVPFALHAKSVDNTDDADADPSNEIQQLVLEGNSLSLTNGNVVQLPANIQELVIEGNVLRISEGNAVTLPSDGDGDNQNEIQELVLNGNTLSISDANAVELPVNNDNDATNEIQTLSLDGNILSISGGNSVTLELDDDDDSKDVPDPANPVPVMYQGSFLFVSPEDNASGIILGGFINAGAGSLFDGESNTAALSGVSSGGDAAQLCADLVAYGFEDWYLPSRAELDAIYKQNYLIVNYELDRYWSSTETADNKAWAIDFADGTFTEETKNQLLRCRCVRKN